MKNITLLKGEGIGPEITESVLKVLEALKLDLNFEEQKIGKEALKLFDEVLPQETLNNITKNKIVLKAPYQTEVGSGLPSVNVALRQRFELYANVRPIKTLLPKQSKHGILDFTIIRENTEDLYIGQEEVIKEDNEVIAIKKITRKASSEISDFACKYAIANNKNKVTSVHKANILKKSDGLFLKTFYETLKNYPNLKAEDMIVDNVAMQLVINPQQFEIMVMPNLYGDILSDLAAGLIGGLGLAPSANIGKNCAIFEASHGIAPDIAGKNLANPTALLLSACLMLEHLNYHLASEQIKTALQLTFENNYFTTDLGGNLSTTEFTEKLISFLFLDSR